MSNILNQIKQRVHSANIVEQLIYINIGTFILTYVLKALFVLMQWGTNPLFSWFALPENSTSFLSKPWTILSYSFLHSGFFHILFNLLVLYYIGNLFLNFFSKRDFLIYYFLGVFFGGLFFVVGYNFFPALKSDTAYLIGASAGVTAILVGIATKIPNYALHFRFIGGVKLWYIAIGFIMLVIMQMSVSNTGGHLAHLGGALTGFLLTTQSNKNGLSFFSTLFKPKKQKPLKTVYKKTNPVQTSVKNSDSHQRKIDAILDKISKSGYDTLTQEEKDFLFTISKK